MAVGVPENEVFAAADAVLARGERPTVERVRLELGRGSPARVGSLLDQWWDRLAQRLRGETRLPSLPSEVSQAFVTVWQEAMHYAQGVAEAGLVEQRAVVIEERAAVSAAETAARQGVAQYRQQAAAALAAQQNAERRFSDLERLLDQSQGQVIDLTQQRDALKSERNSVRERVQEMENLLLASRHEAEQARKAHDIYVRGVEDRAYREVDRAREENKSMQLQLKQLAKQTDQLRQRWEIAVAQVTELQIQSATSQALAEQSEQQRQHTLEKLEAVQTELSQALTGEVAQQARADTLELQVVHLRSLLKPARKKTSPKLAAP
ncbi:plasmid replication region [Pseudomonas sp. Bc-h]|nr:DNA-binding protein [Pseudomonas sp. Bc-h]OQR36619.1 plasmid replication region [Pseudomonas sp. Bc-h]